MDAMEWIGRGIEWAGVAVIVIGGLAATVRYALGFVRGDAEAYRGYRRGLGQAILLGLEFLVAGDIIRTVAVDTTWESVGVLAMVVLIRTFLSFTIDVEIEGRWPWQAKEPA